METRHARGSGNAPRLFAYPWWAMSRTGQPKRTQSGAPAPSGAWLGAAAVLVATPLVTLMLTAPGGGDRAAVPAVAAASTSAAEPVASPAATETPEATPSTKATATTTAKTSKAAKRVPEHGSGEFVANGRAIAAPSGRGRVYTVRVQVEKGVPFDPDTVATTVAATLNDKRSWAGTGEGRFQLVRSGAADVTILLATPDTTDQYCYPLRTWGELSCREGGNVILNAKRWASGAKAYGDDVVNYRRYLVNHEVGHFLGHGHVTCPGAGLKAPVMMQQTKGIGSCKPYPWPVQ